jgi:hypothetical protein
MAAKMAAKMTVMLEDDLDGGPADETLRFRLDGSEYQVDLNKKNARAFRKQLAPFVEHARKADQRRPGRMYISQPWAQQWHPGVG